MAYCPQAARHTLPGAVSDAAYIGDVESDDRQEPALGSGTAWAQCSGNDENLREVAQRIERCGCAGNQGGDGVCSAGRYFYPPVGHQAALTSGDLVGYACSNCTTDKRGDGI